MDTRSKVFALSHRLELLRGHIARLKRDERGGVERAERELQKTEAALERSQEQAAP